MTNTATSAATPQQATLLKVTGKAQVIRDGFFIPAQAGMVLQPGDRISTQAGARLEVRFEGTSTALVVGENSSATLYLQVTEANAPPQWVAADLYGPSVYFAQSAQPQEGMAGLVGQPAAAKTTPSGAETEGGAPLLETLLALAGTAAIYSGSDGNDSGSTVTAAQAAPVSSPQGTNPDNSSSNGAPTGAAAPNNGSSNSGSNSGGSGGGESTSTGGDAGTAPPGDNAAAGDLPIPSPLTELPLLGDLLAPLLANPATPETGPTPIATQAQSLLDGLNLSALIQ